MQQLVPTAALIIDAFEETNDGNADAINDDALR
jgi:hypothetical protein